MNYIILVVSFILFTFIVNNVLSILNYRHRNKPIPDVVKDIYDEEEYKKWHAYSMENFKFALIIRAVSLLVILSLFALNAFPYFQEVSESITSNIYLQLGLFFLFFYVITLVPDKIFSYYHTFKIEEQYGFNKTTKKTFVKDSVKSFLLTIIFGGGIIIGLYALYNNFGVMFYVYGWIALVVIILVVNMIYVSVLVPIFNKLTPLEDGELKNEIYAFAEGVGYQVSKISVMDASKRSSKLNAFFSGFGKFKHIVLFDTLIEKMSTEEIVAVLAHEIGHNKHKHIISNLIQTFIQLGLYFVVLYMVLTNQGFSTDFGFESVHFGFSIILFMELLGPIGVILSPIVSKLSRKAEYQADYYASTKYKKEPMISALKVLSKENFSNLTPHPLFVKMRYSHPPVADRIHAIQNIK